MPGAGPTVKTNRTMENSRQGAAITPRCLFLVDKTEKPANVPDIGTITVNLCRTNQDDPPWSALDLTDISSQTIEREHLFRIHSVETIAPYAAMAPLQALLPVKQSDRTMPAFVGRTGQIDPDRMNLRMQLRWQTINDLWETHKPPDSDFSLAEQLDCRRRLSDQLAWQAGADERPIRIAYSITDPPTAALIADHRIIIDQTLYWTTCRTASEAYYLLALINSNTLKEELSARQPEFPLWQPPVQLWQLPIPEFDPKQKLHLTITRAGERAAAAAERKLNRLQERQTDRIKPAAPDAIRQELRQLLRESAVNRESEAAVAALLGKGVNYRGTITIEPGKRFGKPCIRGLRFTAQDAMEYLAGGMTWAELLEDFNDLTEADLHACLSFAADEQMDDDYRRLRSGSEKDFYPEAPEPGPNPELYHLIRQTQALRHGRFRLRHGGHTGYFFDSPRLTLNPRGSRLAAEAMFNLLATDHPSVNTIVGVAYGAVPIVSQLCLLSDLKGRPLTACFISGKGENAGEVIPPLTEDRPIRAAIIEDVITTGQSALEIAHYFSQTYWQAAVPVIIALLDRNEGGRENIINAGFRFQAVIPDIKDLLQRNNEQELQNRSEMDR